MDSKRKGCACATREAVRHDVVPDVHSGGIKGSVVFIPGGRAHIVGSKDPKGG